MQYSLPNDHICIFLMVVGGLTVTVAIIIALLSIFGVFSSQKRENKGPKYRMSPNARGGFCLEKYNECGIWLSVKNVSSEEEARKIIEHLEKDSVYLKAAD